MQQPMIEAALEGTRHGGRPAMVTVQIQEKRVYAEIRSPTIAVGSDFDFDQELLNARGEEVAFQSLELLQVEWDAPALVATDTLTLSIYRSAARDTDSLLARWSGTSDVTGIWKSIQNDLKLEYFDRQQGQSDSGNIYGRLTNAAGNSAASTFHVLITARVVS